MKHVNTFDLLIFLMFSLKRHGHFIIKQECLKSTKKK